MTAKDLIKYWLDTAEDDFKTGEELIKVKRYNYALFFFHLAIEKMLKGLVYKKTQIHAPPIHNLVNLALQTGLPLTQKQKEDLKEITTWNIRARYDNIKRDFYKKATKGFTTGWFSKVKEYYLWFKKQY